MPLNDIVNVQISTQTQAVPEANFGVPLILGTHKSWNDFVRSYSSIVSVGADFSPQQPEYIAAQSVFSQNPTVTNLLIGRRDVPFATLNVLSAVPGNTYNVVVNGLTASVNSGTLQQVSTITYSTDFISNNLINVVMNNITLGTVTSVITYSADFGNDNVITTVINGSTLPAVTWTTSQANTLSLIAAGIALAPGVASATPGTDKITVVFTNPGNNVVTSSTAVGTTPPTTTIVAGGFTFTTDQPTTMALITAAMLGQSATVASAVAVGDVITVTSVAGTVNFINSSVVSLGVSQPTVAITNNSLNKTIAQALVTAITALAQPVVAAYVASPDGTITITANVSTVPFSLSANSTVNATNVAIVEITDAQPGAIYNLYVQGIQFTYVAPTTVQTTDQISSAFVNLINTYLPAPTFVAVDNGNGSLTITSTNPSTLFFVQITPEVMALTVGINILPYVPQGLVATRLNDIVNVNNQWYGLMCTDRTLTTVKAIADWAESMSATQPVIFGTASSDANIINQAVGVDTTSIAAYVNNRGYVRTFVMYHQDAANEYPEGAWFGVVLPETPGSETWKFKSLAGIAYSTLTNTQSNNVLSKKANTYEFIGGVGITQNGTMGQGEFIDIVRGVDWLRSIITTNVFGILVNLPKVPYTDAGIAAVQAQVQKALQQGVDNNFLTNNPAPVVTVPLAANVPANDKANRVLNNVKFVATVAGAIHAVNIQGIVTV